MIGEQNQDLRCPACHRTLENAIAEQGCLREMCDSSDCFFRQEIEKAVFVADINYRKKKVDIAEKRKDIARFQNCISTGNKHTVGLKVDGSVVAVGDNQRGQCNTEGWRDIIAVSAGHDYTVGLKADGTVIVAGKGDGAVLIPRGKRMVRAADLSSIIKEWCGIVAVCAVDRFTIGLKADGTVVMGGTFADAFDMSETTGKWQDIVAISAGSRYVIGLRANGTVVAAGNHEEGKYKPTNWRDIIAISADSWHTVGLKADGTVVVAARDNPGSQCNTESWQDIVEIATCSNHTVGLKADGTVIAAGGYNYCGACKTGEWRSIVAVSVGYSKAQDSRVNNFPENATLATKIAALAQWQQGSYLPEQRHTIGLKADGTVVAVGDNQYGQCDVEDWKDIGPVPGKPFNFRALLKTGRFG